MTVTVMSFSFKRGLPEDPTGNGGGFMFDCRAMPNPFWDETLRGYTGRDKPVCDFFARFPKTVEPFLEATETLVRQSIEQYRRDGRVHLQVAFGCTGNAPAAKRSGCLSARCTCGEAVRFPDEQREALCKAKSQEGARCAA